MISSVEIWSLVLCGPKLLSNRIQEIKPSAPSGPAITSENFKVIWGFDKDACIVIIVFYLQTFSLHNIIIIILKFDVRVGDYN